MKPLPPESFDVLARQERLLTRRQLAKLGFTANNIEDAVRSGQWSMASSRVVHLGTRPLSRRQLLFVHALHFENLALTGIAALELDGLSANHDERIDLIGPRGTRVEPSLPCVIHTSRRPVEYASDFPRRTTHAYSVVHAMAWSYTFKQALHMAYWAIQRGMVTKEQLYRVAIANRRSKIMELALPRVLALRDQVDTVHEHLFVTLCPQYGLPEPIHKPAFELDNGVVLHPDFAFRKGKQTLVVELDGKQHFTEEGIRIDRFREMIFADYGAQTHRIRNTDLTDNPDGAMKALRFKLDRL